MQRTDNAGKEPIGDRARTTKKRSEEAFQQLAAASHPPLAGTHARFSSAPTTAPSPTTKVRGTMPGFVQSMQTTRH